MSTEIDYQTLKVGRVNSELVANSGVFGGLAVGPSGARLVFPVVGHRAEFVQEPDTCG